MQTMSPTSRLDDPGIGLRDNGRRVLTYADLRSIFDDPDGREPGRTIELHLTGHMERFAWSFNGVKFSDAEPLRLTYGERLRIVLVNDTMMTHPIHLHGMWSDLEDDEGKFQVRKHTVDMPPGTQRVVSRDRRCAGPLGLPLPPAVPHGSRHVSGSAGRGMSRASARRFVSIVGTCCWRSRRRHWRRPSHTRATSRHQARRPSYTGPCRHANTLTSRTRNESCRPSFLRSPTRTARQRSQMSTATLFTRSR